MEQTTIVINKTDKPNSFSFRYGGTGTDVKIYYNELDDLIQRLSEVVEAKKYIELNLGGK